MRTRVLLPESTSCYLSVKQGEWKHSHKEGVLKLPLELNWRKQVCEARRAASKGVCSKSLCLQAHSQQTILQSIGVGMWGRCWALSILREPKRQRKSKPVNSFIAHGRESQSTHSYSFINQQMQASMVFCNTMEPCITQTTSGIWPRRALRKPMDLLPFHHIELTSSQSATTQRK